MIPSEPPNTLAVPFSESQVAVCFAVPCVYSWLHSSAQKTVWKASPCLAVLHSLFVCAFTSKQGPWMKWYVHHSSQAENVFS